MPTYLPNDLYEEFQQETDRVQAQPSAPPAEPLAPDGVAGVPADGTVPPAVPTAETGAADPASPSPPATLNPLTDQPVANVDQPVTSYPLAGRGQVTNQFASGLSYDDALAACGPVAAQALARAYGSDIPITEVVKAARESGWDTAGGMNGIQNEKRLLDKLGIPSKLDTQANWGKIAQDAAAGNPVIISTPKHYYYANDYNPDTGQYFVGESGKAFKSGGGAWMTVAQITGQGGGINGVLFAGSPTSDRPSVAEQPHPQTARGWQTYASGLMQGTLATVGQVKDTGLSTIEDWRQHAADLLSSTVSGAQDAAKSVPQTIDDWKQHAADLIAQTAQPADQAKDTAPTFPADRFAPDVTPEQAASQQVQNYPQLPSPPDLAAGPTGGKGLVGAALATVAQLSPGELSPQAAEERALAPNYTRKMLAGEQPTDAEKQAALNEGFAVAGMVGPLHQPGGIAGDAARMYHGTGSAFDTPTASMFKENGLFGPGYYLTDDPRVASSYADVRKPDVNWIDPENAAAQIKMLRGYLASPDLTPGLRSTFTKEITSIEETVRTQPPPPSGPNVRPVDAPKNLNLLDADAPAPPELLAKIHQYDLFSPNETLTGNTGGEVYNILTNALRSKSEATDWLAANGYDGIRYNGGQRIPMKDSAGAPIEHTAVVIFPDSQQKITNALSGRAGGSAMAGAATRIGGAAIGGGATAATTDPNDPNYWLKVGAGTAAGFAGGSAAVRLAESVAGRGATEDAAKVGWRAADQPDPILKALGPAPEIEPVTPKYGNSLGEKITTQLFSADQPLRSFEDDVARLTGKPLSMAEKPSEVARLNTDRAGKVIIDEQLKPIIQSAGNDLEALQALVKARNNVSIARGMANAAAEEGRATNPLFQSLNVTREAPLPGQDLVPGIADLPTAADASKGAEALAKAEAIRTGRTFPGGVTGPESAQAINTLAQQLGPERFAKVNAAADQLFAYTARLRPILADAGVWPKSLPDALAKQYPDWINTKILDYMQAAPEQGGLAYGKKISLSDNGLKRYTDEGTARLQEDPLQSVIDLTNSTLARARQNQVFTLFKNLDERLPEDQRIMRPLVGDESVLPHELPVTGFVDGVKTRYAVPKDMANVIAAAQSTMLPGWARAYTNFFRDLTTSKNPAFLAKNAALDIPDYTLYMTSQLGPSKLPEIIGELAKSYATTFDGLLQSEFRGATAEVYKAGAGMSGPAGASRATKQTVADLARKNVFEVKNLADVKRLMVSVAKAEPIAAIAERIEAAPRGAAYRLMQKYGTDSVQPAITARSVTNDWARGGAGTKVLAQIVPYFNVPFQTTAQVVRMYRNNPQGFVATMTGLIGGPTVAATAWNLSDPKRATDYADAPQYFKDNGIVLAGLSIPGLEAKDPSTGEVIPNLAWINLRQFAPFATAARAATEKVMTGTSQDWGSLLDSMLMPDMPIDPSNPAYLASKAASGIPGLSTAAQLGMNKNTFTGGNIVTRRNDEQAGGTARAIAGGVNAALQATQQTNRLHPSQIEFGAPSLLGGAGAVALGAGDIALGGKPGGALRNMPVVGGALGSFYRPMAGQQLREAQQRTIAPDAQKILEDAGLANSIPGPVGSEIRNIPLSQSEETRLQQLTNQYLSQAIREVPQGEYWASDPPATRQRVLQRAMTSARTRAELEVLGTIPDDVREQRRALSQQRNAPVPIGAPVPAR